MSFEILILIPSFKYVAIFTSLTKVRKYCIIAKKLYSEIYAYLHVLGFLDHKKHGLQFAFLCLSVGAIAPKRLNLEEPHFAYGLTSDPARNCI